MKLAWPEVAYFFGVEVFLHLRYAFRRDLNAIWSLITTIRGYLGNGARL